MTTTNIYYSNGRTYEPFYTYFRPLNYYNAGGYYSRTFLLIYYDGYGYNFYYGNYGYYEYSVNERQGGGSGVVIVIAVCSVCCCFLMCFMMIGGGKEEE